jgi:hypothetical protein
MIPGVKGVKKKRKEKNNGCFLCPLFFSFLFFLTPFTPGIIPAGELFRSSLLIDNRTQRVQVGPFLFDTPNSVGCPKKKKGEKRTLCSAYFIHTWSALQSVLFSPFFFFGQPTEFGVSNKNGPLQIQRNMHISKHNHMIPSLVWNRQQDTKGPGRTI